MRVLITGAAGFIGSHLSEILVDQPGVEVVGIDNFNSYYAPSIKRSNVSDLLQKSNFSLVECDLCDFTQLQTALEGVDFTHVVHLAAYAGVRSSVRDPHLYTSQNLPSTSNILEIARQRHVERLLFTSSSTVYGLGGETPFREDGKMGVPASPYGATKRACEFLVETYGNTFDLPYVILRPFSVYGPRVRPDLAMWLFTDAILNGKPLTVFGDGSAQRDFTHVSDICAGLISALTAEDAVGEAINLGCDHPVTVSHLIETLESGLGKEAIIEYEPTITEDLPMTWANLTKARQILNYAPTTDFEAGVKAYAQWFAAGQPAVSSH